VSQYGAAWSGISQLCLKLSNSGDTLKLFISSQGRKVLSGWNNYPGMVTSKKMIENEMGYRGSKSDAFNNKVSVKEQRVDGSWSNYLLSKSNSLLRCTLMGFERNYPVRTLSKQLNKLFFSTVSVKPSQLNAYFVTGFCDAESSFSH
jgi:hypothetical protein